MTPTPIKFIVGGETFEAFIEDISLKEQHRCSRFTMTVICLHDPDGDMTGLRMAKALRESMFFKVTRETET